MAASSKHSERQERDEQLKAFHQELEKSGGMDVSTAATFLEIHALDFADALIERTDLDWDGASWVFHVLAQEAADRSETMTFLEMRELQEKHGEPGEEITVDQVKEWIEAEGEDPNEHLPEDAE